VLHKRGKEEQTPQEKIKKTEEITSMGKSVGLTEAEKKTIEDFIEHLRTTQNKRETYVPLNQNLISLSG